MFVIEVIKNVVTQALSVFLHPELAWGEFEILCLKMIHMARIYRSEWVYYFMNNKQSTLLASALNCEKWNNGEEF